VIHTKERPNKKITTYPKENGTKIYNVHNPFSSTFARTIGTSESTRHDKTMIPTRQDNNVDKNNTNDSRCRRRCCRCRRSDDAAADDDNENNTIFDDDDACVERGDVVVVTAVVAAVDVAPPGRNDGNSIVSQAEGNDIDPGMMLRLFRARVIWQSFFLSRFVGPKPAYFSSLC
jgi:hypothetical protein